MSSGGGKPVQFSMFGWEISCKTSATWKMTVNLNYFDIDIFANDHGDASENRTCVAEVSS